MQLVGFGRTDSDMIPLYHVVTVEKCKLLRTSERTRAYTLESHINVSFSLVLLTSSHHHHFFHNSYLPSLTIKECREQSRAKRDG